jgi:hypothetical protein
MSQMKFVRSDTVAGLNEKVNAALADGWEYLELQQTQCSNSLWVVVALRKD